MTAPLSLYELNGLVEDTLKLSLSSTYHVVAEISSLNLGGNGHCYMELVERKEKGAGIVAKASAHIWKNTYNLLAPYFESKTGVRLAAGIKILVEVEVGFHAVYGYSLNIIDIDPTYTMGDMARQRQEILQQLEEDGILHLNQELKLPTPTLRIAVISSETAAGYGDFCHQLSQSPFAFTTELYPSLMQGNGVEQGIIHSLDAIMNDLEKGKIWDAVVIIRGGGATSDLNCFDAYLLAANVAQFPIPVLTGIGHERDETVLDFVAHRRLKTPTAVAAFLVNRAESLYHHLNDWEEALHQAVRNRLERTKNHYQCWAQRFMQAAGQYAARQQELLTRFETQLHHYATRPFQTQHIQLNNWEMRCRQIAKHFIEQEKTKIKAYDRSLEMLSPERMLKLGYSITTKNGKVVRNSTDLQPGDLLTTTLHKGRITSKVEEI